MASDTKIPAAIKAMVIRSIRQSTWAEARPADCATRRSVAVGGVSHGEAVAVRIVTVRSGRPRATLRRAWLRSDEHTAHSVGPRIVSRESSESTWRVS